MSTRDETIKSQWQAAEDAGLVEFAVVADESADPDNILCCCGESDCETEHRAPELERANRDGVWGIVGRYRVKPSGKFTPADSVWGFIGDSWKDSGYDVDVKAKTLDALRNALYERCETCRQVVCA